MNDIHAGDIALNIVLRGLDAIYSAPASRTNERLGAYLKPKIKGLQARRNESAREYHSRLLLAFSGPRWRLVKRHIAEDFTSANASVTERVNDALEMAFMDGMNESAYLLALSGAEVWPITASIVGELAAANIVTLHRRKLRKRKDTAYNAQRLQSAISAAIAQNVDIEDMPDHVARRMVSAIRNEIATYARAAIYGASDYGAYMAGREAENVGLEIEKTWLAIMDMRVRPSHKHLHGETVPLNEKFHGYHGVLRFPHDPDAPPQEIYRCRCRMAVHLAGESPVEYSRRILPTQSVAYKKWRDKQIAKAGGEVALAKIHKQLMG